MGYHLYLWVKETDSSLIHLWKYTSWKVPEQGYLKEENTFFFSVVISISYWKDIAITVCPAECIIQDSIWIDVTEAWLKQQNLNYFPPMLKSMGQVVKFLSYSSRTSPNIQTCSSILHQHSWYDFCPQDKCSSWHWVWGGSRKVGDV